MGLHVSDVTQGHWITYYLWELFPHRCPVLWPYNLHGHPHRTICEHLPASLLDHLGIFFFFSGISNGPCNNWHYLRHVKHVDDDDNDITQLCYTAVAACGCSQFKSMSLAGPVTLGWHVCAHCPLEWEEPSCRLWPCAALYLLQWLPETQLIHKVNKSLRCGSDRAQEYGSVPVIRVHDFLYAVPTSTG